MLDDPQTIEVTDFWLGYSSSPGCRPGDGRRTLDRAGSSSLPATRTRCTTSSLPLSAMITSCGSSSTAEEIPDAIPNGSVGVFGGADLPLCHCLACFIHECAHPRSQRVPNGS